MSTVNEAIPQLMAYHPALIALAILCTAVLIQAVLAGVIGLGKSPEQPGMPLKGSHEDFSFRTLRTYANSVENLPAFGITAFLAIVAGLGPVWVNWLVGIHVALRLVYWVVYYTGVGKVEGGPRTITYALGAITNLVLALGTLLAFVSS